MSKRRTKGTGGLNKHKNGIYYAVWINHEGRERRRSTRTKDKSSALRILNSIVAEDAEIRAGVVDSRKLKISQQSRRPIREHIADYIEHCRRIKQSAHNVNQKESRLERFVDATQVDRLDDVTAEILEGYMATITDEGNSARTANHARQIVVALCSWCVKNNRMSFNPVKSVKKYNEDTDRRRVRRPLTDDEVGRLLNVARQRGREAWYMAALLAGLRKGDLKRLKWCDIDFENMCITIRGGKSQRTDQVPLHPDLGMVLKQRQTEMMAMPKANVFPEVVTDRTRQKDFLRAGIARRVPVKDEEGEVVLIGEGDDAVPKMKIVTEDENGYVVDLHAMRTTLGTKLARAGVSPQICQQIMRHSDYQTTLNHYTVLGLQDTTQAIEKIGVNFDENVIVATGTDDNVTVSGYSLNSSVISGETTQLSARRCQTGEPPGEGDEDDESSQTIAETNTCNAVPSGAIISSPTAGVAQLVERQLPKQATQAGNTANKGISARPSNPNPLSHPLSKKKPKDKPLPDDLPPDLRELIDAWDTLPERIKAGIMAMVRCG